MSRRFRLVAFFALCILPILAACDDDDVQEILHYDITIINSTGTDYEVWIDVDVDAAGFVQDGTVDGGTMRVLRDRVIDVGYHIRLTEPGQDPDTTFEHERTIEQGSDTDVTWTVDP